MRMTENILSEFVAFLDKSAALVQEQADQMQPAQTTTGNNAPRMESTNPFGNAGGTSAPNTAAPVKPLTDTSKPLKTVKFNM